MSRKAYGVYDGPSSEYGEHYVHLAEGEQVYKVTLRRSIPRIVEGRNARGESWSAEIDTDSQDIVASSEKAAIRFALKRRAEYDADEVGTSREEAPGNVWTFEGVEVNEYILCQYCGLVGGH